MCLWKKTLSTSTRRLLQSQNSDALFIEKKMTTDRPLEVCASESLRTPPVLNPKNEEKEKEISGLKSRVVFQICQKNEAKEGEKKEKDKEKEKKSENAKIANLPKWYEKQMIHKSFQSAHFSI